MANTYVKQAAQEALMHAMMGAFYALGDSGKGEDDPITVEARKQVKRVEKLFGYEPGSWRE